MRRSPFSPFTVAALVLAGGGMLLAMLLMAGSGLLMGELNNGDAHGGGRGLNGYAAFYRLLDASGYDVALGRDESAIRQPGLLVLTPPQGAKGEDIAKIVATHRAIGPVLLITPKWLAAAPSAQRKGVQKGWVELTGVAAPAWTGFLDDVTVTIAPATPQARDDLGHIVTLPYPDQVLSGEGDRLVDWVRDGNGRTLAGEVDSGETHPLVVLFEPDLANNAGMARRENADLMGAIVHDLLPAGQRLITFDVTLNGLGRSPNLLTLAFTPPYLAATLCLLLAALAAGWRAFHRFGPALTEARALNFGKQALADNAAGLIRRTGRWRLLPVPYADATRDRIVAALGLSPHADRAANDAAIDRALHARAPLSEPFTAALTRLRAARRPQDILRAAQTLHAIERMLIR